MKALQAIEEILNRVFKWHRFPVSLKAEAVLLYFKEPWYVSAVEKLSMKWEHETFGKRNVVERWFFYIKHRMKRFYKRFPWNAKYETVFSWFASFIVLYTIKELKS